MATVEVFTIGGGEYVVNIFNAVAAWTGSGGYKSMIQTVLVMAFAMSTMLVAFNQDWKAWIHWFLQATLMYLVLMVPRMDVQVVDRINPGLPAANVANVPIGLAMMASFTSQIGDYLVRSSEVVFGLPNDLNYSRNGMIYGSRLLEATNGLSINDAEFAANLDEHYRLCVFYDVMLGRKSMEQLKGADDLWAVLGPGSDSRSQKFLTRDAGGNVTSDIVSCREAYTRLSDDWNRMLDELAKVFGKQLYPKEVPDLAKAKLFADLPVAYEYLTGVSKDASEIMKQTLAINAMSQAMHSFSGSTGVSSVDVYAQTRAEIQTRNTYNSIAHNAMKWVPILNIVLTVVFYALFPIIFPLFLLPRTGPPALKGYVTGFFYLAAWGPLYVILHMVMMLKSHTDVAGAAVGGVTLASWNGVQAVNADVGILAGYLVASIPFLAAGMARGAMAISGHATSYLNPSQNAAEEAAREASTGNLSFGNTSFDNASYNNRQGNVWASAANYSSGYGGIHGFNADGTSTGYYPESTVLDQSKGISRLAVTPTLASDLQSSFTTNASREHSVARTTAQEASSAVSTANTRSCRIITAQGMRRLSAAQIHRWRRRVTIWRRRSGSAVRPLIGGLANGSIRAKSGQAPTLRWGWKFWGTAARLAVDTMSREATGEGKGRMRRTIARPIIARRSPPITKASAPSHVPRRRATHSQPRSAPRRVSRRSAHSVSARRRSGARAMASRSAKISANPSSTSFLRSRNRTPRLGCLQEAGTPREVLPSPIRKRPRKPSTSKSSSKAVWRRFGPALQMIWWM
jgi:conjugal transfer mating pair stabilization protein TraG